MNILHYTLGLYPYRTGGLTKYSMDLMQEETKSNKVFMCFPGKNTLIKKFRIKKYKVFKGIETFELINTLPVPLLGGVSEVEAFIKDIPTSIEEIEKFLLNIKPDIIHIHTLMGLPKEFIKVAKKFDIKTVFTTHDYYGLCPRCNFINCDGDLGKCDSCNNNAYSLNMIDIMQSTTYRKLKETKILSLLRKNTKKLITKDKKQIVSTCESFSKYAKFREYYKDIIENINSIHFNSSVSKKVFEKYCKINDWRMLSITHGNIKDSRIKKVFNSNRLRILFIGPLENYKGFSLLIDALSEINFDLWELQVYGNSYEIELKEGMNVKFNGRYNYLELSEIMKNNDVLIVPSIWKETFGFIVLEAISHGMPVICNKNVGACDIIKHKETGLICDGTQKDLRNAVENIINNPEILEKINRNILNNGYTYDMQCHCFEILNLYKQILLSDTKLSE